MFLVDTHCHLDFPEFDHDRDEVIRRAHLQGVDRIINIGSSLEGSKRSVELADKYDSLYATVGIHPHEADRINQDSVRLIKELASLDKVVAIGEIGLDYFKQYSDPKNQLPLFLDLLKVAKELDLPVVIHSRDAQKDTLKILKKAMPIKAVVHCFSGDSKFLEASLDLGFLISFTSNVTYKKAEGLRELLKIVPLDNLLLETDAPYLSPEGFRGKRNEPAYVRMLAEFVADLRKIKLEELAHSTTENAKRFFSLR